MASDSKPRHRGLRIIGTCKNRKCVFHGQEVSIAWAKTTPFELAVHSPNLLCPECKTHIRSPTRFDFESCKWQCSGAGFTWERGNEAFPDSDAWIDSSTKSSLIVAGRTLTSLKISTEPSEGSVRLYKMHQTPHGICLIINNIQFHDSRQDRHGAEADSRNLSETFRKLGYDVRLFENLSADDMRGTITQYCAQHDHSQYDSFVCCLLSHGGRGNVLSGVDDGFVKVQDLVDMVKVSTTLAGKPKIFIVQACRGGEESRSLVVTDNAIATAPQREVRVEATIPDDADVVIINATSPGKVAYRTASDGSWFIQILCDVLSTNADKLYLSQMLKRVNEIICEKEQSKQCLDTQDRLRKEIHFFPTAYY